MWVFIIQSWLWGQFSSHWSPFKPVSRHLFAQPRSLSETDVVDGALTGERLLQNVKQLHSALLYSGLSLETVLPRMHCDWKEHL